MNKQEFINLMMENEEMSKKDAEKAVNAYHATVQKALEAGEKIQFVGFGTYDIDARAGRDGHNPKNPSETIKIAGAVYPKFSFGKPVKDAVKDAQAKNLNKMLKAKGIEVKEEKPAGKKGGKKK